MTITAAAPSNTIHDMARSLFINGADLSPKRAEQQPSRLFTRSCCQGPGKSQPPAKDQKRNPGRGVQRRRRGKVLRPFAPSSRRAGYQIGFLRPQYVARELQLQRTSFNLRQPRLSGAKHYTLSFDL